MKARFSAPLIATVFLCCVPAFAENAPMRSEEKIERKLKFNEYVATTKASRSQSRKFWRVFASTACGYDDNVALDSTREGDLFHEETVAATVEVPSSALGGIVPAASIGLKGTANYLLYHDRIDSDYEGLSTTPFVKWGLGRSGQLSLEYKLRSSRYPRNDQSTYVAQGGRVVLQNEWAAGIGASPFFSYERRDYTDRKALSEDDLSSETDRKDDVFKAGGTVAFRVFDTRTYLSSAWVKNDSNDNFEDFNDYEGLNASALFEISLWKDATAVMSGGYQLKKYEDRTFIAGSSRTERDGFYYMGATLYYALAKNFEAVLTYQYNQNDSNDPLQEYSGSILSAGLQIQV